MKRFFMLACILWAGLAVAPEAFAQKKVEFEVASIRPAEQPTRESIMAGKLNIGMRVDGARAEFRLMSLRELITTAYRVKQDQVQGPDWLPQQRFDIAATIPEGASKDQVPEMLQALLAERFHLKLRRETKDKEVYALMQAKDGHKMKPAVEEAPKAPDANAPKPLVGAMVNGQAVGITQAGQGMAISGGEAGPMKMQMSPDGAMQLEFSNTSMAKFAEQLSRFADRPVIDMTELQGNFQVAVEASIADLLAVARSQGGVNIGNLGNIGGGGAGPTGGAGNLPPALAAALSEPAGGRIFASLGKQGLRLDGRKAPMDLLVVESIDKTPTEN